MRAHRRAPIDGEASSGESVTAPVSASTVRQYRRPSGWYRGLRMDLTARTALVAARRHGPDARGPALLVLQQLGHVHHRRRVVGPPGRRRARRCPHGIAATAASPPPRPSSRSSSEELAAAGTIAPPLAGAGVRVVGPSCASSPPLEQAQSVLSPSSADRPALWTVLLQRTRQRPDPLRRAVHG